MPWLVALGARAQKSLERVPAPDRRRINAAIR